MELYFEDTRERVDDVNQVMHGQRLFFIENSQACGSSSQARIKEEVRRSFTMRLPL
jgi:hypothetical protein